MTSITKPTFILGIDPGLSGALAVIDVAAIAGPGKIVAIIDMPKIKRGTRSDLDLSSLAVFIDTWAGQVKYAVVEDVAAAPKQGVVSMFTFGKVTGIVVGMIAAHYIPIFYVKPSVWKFQMGLSASKDDSIKKARKFWPSSNQFAHKKDDGRAEAALLAFFGRRFDV